MKVEVLPVDWSDEQVADVNAFENTLLAELDPELAPRPASVTRAHRDIRVDPVRLAVARSDDDRVVGTAWIEAATGHNTHLVFSTLSTVEDMRRQGIATALFREVAEFAQQEGRREIVLGCDRYNEGAEAMATSLGAVNGLSAHINKVRIADVDAHKMQAWVDASHPDYAIEWITPDGPYPEERMADMAHLRGVLVSDAPMDGVPLEPHTITFEEIRTDEQRGLAYGVVRMTVIARHTPSGDAVGYTEVFVNAHDPRTLQQGATAVDPSHRGHALGRQLKAAMFQRIVRERPDAEFIRTFNADSNGPMLAVNHDMGFAPHSQARRWVISTDDALAWLENRP
jgi:GNAT superfamily N-acetyltransferase